MAFCEDLVITEAATTEGRGLVVGGPLPVRRQRSAASALAVNVAPVPLIVP